MKENYLINLQENLSKKLKKKLPLKKFMPIKTLQITCFSHKHFRVGQFYRQTKKNIVKKNHTHYSKNQKKII